MALPSCPKCGNHMFTTSEIEPSGSNFKFIAVICSSCGTIVGVQEFFNVGQLIHDLAKQLGVKL
jgi:predicted nucleic-acid-binding Zn-ribbon protein